MDRYGDFLSIAERLVVSPAWGHLRTASREGQYVEESAVLGRITAGAEDVLLRAPVGGVFLGWIALEGELVWQGTPLARILGR